MGIQFCHLELILHISNVGTENYALLVDSVLFYSGAPYTTHQRINGVFKSGIYCN